MPTLQQWVDEQKARGASREEIANTFKQAYGEDVTALDAGLDYDAYKAGKLAAKAASLPPVKIVPATGSQAAIKAAVTKPFSEWFKKPDAVAPAPAIELPEAGAAATALPAGAPTGPERGVDYELELPTPNIIADRLRGTIPGIAKGVLGDTKLTRGLEAVATVASELPSPASLAGMGVNKALESVGAPAILPVDSFEQRKARIEKSVKRVPEAYSDVVNLPQAAANLEKAMGASQAERMARAVTAEQDVSGRVAQVGKNVGNSLYNLAASMADLANKTAGINVVPAGQTALETGLHTAKEMGESVPGTVIDLARGLSDGESNSLWTDPFATWLMVIDPLHKTARRNPTYAKAADAVAAEFKREIVEPFVDKAVNSALPNAAQELLASWKRTVANGVMQGDRRWTGIMSQMLSEDAPAAIRNLGEMLGRQIDKGAVEPVEVTSKPTRVSVVPRADTAAGKVAERVAGKAATEAGKAGGVADAVTQAADAAREVVGEVRGAQRAAGKVERVIAEEAPKFDRQELKNRLGEQAAGQARQTAADMFEARDSRLRSEAEARKAAEVSRREGMTSVYTGKKGFGVADAKADLVRTQALNEFATLAQMREAQSRRIREQQAKSPAKVAAAAIEAAQKAGEIDAATAADMTRQAAAEARKRARPLQTKAEQAALEAADAAVTPQVPLGELYVDPARTGPGKVTAFAKTSPVQGQRVTLAEQFPEVRKEVIDAIDEAAFQTGRAKKAAVDALAIDPDAVPVNAPMAARAGFDAAATWYENAREYADHLVGRNVDGAASVLAEGIKQLADTSKMRPAELSRFEAAAPLVADWLLSEVELRNKARAIEVDYGAIRRPTPEVTQMGIDPATGRITEMPRVASELWERGERVAQGAETLLERVDKGIGELLDRMEDAPAEITDRIYGLLESVRDNPERIAEIIAGESNGLPREVRTELQQLVERSSKGIETLPERTEPRKAQQELYEMGGRRLVPEAPKPFETKNQIAEQATGDIAKIVRESGYAPTDAAPGNWQSVDPIDLGGVTTSRQFVEVADQGLKRLSENRIKQRLIDALDNDSTQLLRSKEIRTALTREFAARAEAAGLTGQQLWRATADFMGKLEEGKRTNALSKNRFFEVENPMGPGKLWTRADFADVIGKVDPASLNKVRGSVARDVAGDMADAVLAYNLTHDIYREVNRFRRDAKGADIDATFTNVDGYVREMVRRVLQEGEAGPLMMPFSGEAVASSMTANAGRLADKFGVPERAVQKLANDTRKFVEAKGDGSLSKAFEGYWQDVFKSTEPPPDLINVHIRPSAVDTLRGHFSMLAASNALGPLPNLVREVGQRGKAGVVAENLRALVNNDMANVIVNGFRRADPSMLGNLVATPLEFKAFLDGNYDKLGPRKTQMYRALAQTNILDSTQLRSDIGKSRLYEAFSKVFEGTADAINYADAVTGGKVSKVPDAVGAVQKQLRDWYQSVGDVPFRLEEAVATYTDAMKKVEMLQPGEAIKLPTGTGRQTVIERGDGGYNITDTTGPRGVRKVAGEVAANSPEMAKVLADTANFVQERVFFDYGKLGNWGKYLRSSQFSLLSGIFSWFFKAIDIPFIKRGLVSELMSGPPRFETTSPAVNTMQNNAAAGWAGRRAFMTAAARSAFEDQRNLALLSRAYSWTPQVLGAILAQSTSPWYANVRNIEPLLSTQPSATAMGALEAASSYAAYGDLLAQPDEVRKLLRPDPAVLAAMTPEERARADAMRKGLMNYAMGEQFSVKQALGMIGLGGGPLLSILQRMQGAEQGGPPFTLADGVAEFGKQMFGATLFNAADVAAGGLTKLGLEGASRWTTYGKAMSKQGFRGAGGDQTDEAAYTRWAIRNLLGIGYAEVYFGEGDIENPATGKKYYGRAKIYLNSARKQLTQNLVGPAEAASIRAQITARQDPTPENVKAAADARSLYETLKGVVNDEIDRLDQDLTKQFYMLKAIGKDE